MLSHLERPRQIDMRMKANSKVVLSMSLWHGCFDSWLGFQERSMQMAALGFPDEVCLIPEEDIIWASRKCTIEYAPFKWGPGVPRDDKNV